MTGVSISSINRERSWRGFELAISQPAEVPGRASRAPRRARRRGTRDNHHVLTDGLIDIQKCPLVRERVLARAWIELIALRGRAGGF